MTTIILKDHIGTFAENKDTARRIRIEHILPTLARGDSVTLDFSGVEGATQSFVHALVSEPIRTYGSEALDAMHFKHCNESVQKIIGIVAEYLQESL